MSLIIGRVYGELDDSKQNLPVAVDSDGKLLVSGGGGGGMTNAEFQANFPLPVSQTAIERTPSFDRVSVDGSVNSGYRSISFAVNSGTATILGTTLNSFDSVNGISFGANDQDTLGAIPYTISPGGELFIAKVA